MAFEYAYLVRLELCVEIDAKSHAPYFFNALRNVGDVPSVLFELFAVRHVARIFEHIKDPLRSESLAVRFSRLCKRLYRCKDHGERSDHIERAVRRFGRIDQRPLSYITDVLDRGKKFFELRHDVGGRCHVADHLLPFFDLILRKSQIGDIVFRKESYTFKFKIARRRLPDGGIFFSDAGGVPLT